MSYNEVCLWTTKILPLCDDIWCDDGDEYSLVYMHVQNYFIINHGLRLKEIVTINLPCNSQIKYVGDK